MDQQVRVHQAIRLIVGSFLLVLLMIAIPTALAATNEKTTAHVNITMKMDVQITPTVDPTVTALEKEKLQHEDDWIWSNSATILSTIAIVIGALFGFFRWLREQRIERDKRMEDQHIEQKKRDEERFQAIVGALGSERPESRTGSAIMLRTFLKSGYESFYGQAFDLAVANLRLRTVDPNIPEPPDSLNQALTILFKESFPLARSELEHRSIRLGSQYLDASHIQLDKTYLAGADLVKIWMPNAYLRTADLNQAHITEANLSGVNLSEANLSGAQLTGTNLFKANLSWANLSGANLSGANLSEANLIGVNLTETDLTGADLTGANPEAAKALQRAKFINVVGLTIKQLDTCAARDASI